MDEVIPVKITNGQIYYYKRIGEVKMAKQAEVPVVDPVKEAWKDSQRAMVTIITMMINAILAFLIVYIPAKTGLSEELTSSLFDALIALIIANTGGAGAYVLGRSLRNTGNK